MRQKYHSRKVWWRKGVYFVTAKKQSEKGEPESKGQGPDTVTSVTAPWSTPLTRFHLLNFHHLPTMPSNYSLVYGLTHWEKSKLSPSNHFSRPHIQKLLLWASSPQTMSLGDLSYLKHSSHQVVNRKIVHAIWIVGTKRWFTYQVGWSRTHRFHHATQNNVQF